MSHLTPADEKTPAQIHHPVFAAVYDWLARRGPVRRMNDPLRQETAGQAYGLVLEVGAGSGLNFPFYTPGRVERVEAVEPDAAMLAYASRRLATAPVPITLTQVQLPDQTIRHVTPLSPVQEQILRLLGFPADLYAGLAREIPQTAFPLRE